MRQITARFASDCRECGASIEAGTVAVHEKGVGLFCIGCAPTDPEVIRAYRTERAERKAARREEWAKGHQKKAEALHGRDDHLRQDWAFVTQPGHIPERARMIRRTERAWEHSKAAAVHQAKANSLRAGVVVAGDRERRRQAEREAADTLISKGDLIDSGLYGQGVVTKINAKTYTVAFRGGAFITTIDKSWARLVEKRAPSAIEYKFKAGDTVVCRRLLARYPGKVLRRTSTGYSVEYTFAGRPERGTFGLSDVHGSDDECRAAQRADGL